MSTDNSSISSSKTRLMHFLGGAGLIPFLAATLAELMALDWGITIPPILVLMTYGAIILSFLGGVLWGRALHRAASDATHGLLIMSNVFSLLAWATLLLNSIFWTLLLQMIGFAALLAVERSLARGSTMTTQSHYYPMRLILTTSVIVCQLLVLGNHLFE